MKNLRCKSTKIFGLFALTLAALWVCGVLWGQEPDEGDPQAVETPEPAEQDGWFVTLNTPPLVLQVERKVFSDASGTTREQELAIKNLRLLLQASRTSTTIEIDPKLCLSKPSECGEGNTAHVKVKVKGDELSEEQRFALNRLTQSLRKNTTEGFVVIETFFEDLAVERAIFEAIRVDQEFVFQEIEDIGRAKLGPDFVLSLPKAAFQLLINSIVLDLPEEILEDVRALPEVKSVNPNVGVIPLLDTSVSTVGAKTLHEVPPPDGPYTGAGIVVAVIDGGINYSHPDLSDPDFGGKTDIMWENPGEIDGNGVDDDDSGIVDDVHGYNAQTCQGIPPETNEGYKYHGTIVADVVHSVAPDAQLIDITLAFDLGGTGIDKVIEAIEWVMGRTNCTPSPPSSEVCATCTLWGSRRADVINMSFEPSPPEVAEKGQDLIDAVNNAVTATNLVIAAAAGNKGPAYFTVVPPGAAEKAITVGNFYDWNTAPGGSECPSGKTVGGLFDDRIYCGSSSGYVYKDFAKGEILMKPEIVAPGWRICAAYPGFSQGCGLVRKEIGPVGCEGQQYICRSDWRVDPITNECEFYACTECDFATCAPSPTYECENGQIVPVCEVIYHPGFDPKFSCKGHQDEFGNWLGARALTGTSFSSPHVAGAAALLLDAFPNWDTQPEKVKAALLNTSRKDVQGALPKIFRQGTGGLDVAKAAFTPFLASPGIFAFGEVPSCNVPPLIKSQDIVLTNLSGKGLTLSITDDTSGFPLPPDVIFDYPTSVTLGPKGPSQSKTITVSLTSNIQLPAYDLIGAGYCASQPEPLGYAGKLLIDGGATTVEVPFFLSVKGIQVTDVNPVSPTVGCEIGGEQVTIRGRGFDDTTIVGFGGAPATVVPPVEETEITVLAPAHAPGVVDITLEDGCGNIVTLPNAFTYVEQATVSSVSPTFGSTFAKGKGVDAAISGANLGNVNRVFLRHQTKGTEVDAVDFTPVSPTQVDFTVGACIDNPSQPGLQCIGSIPAGDYDVLVENACGESLTTAVFTFANLGFSAQLGSGGAGSIEIIDVDDNASITSPLAVGTPADIAVTQAPPTAAGAHLFSLEDADTLNPKLVRRSLDNLTQAPGFGDEFDFNAVDEVPNALAPDPVDPGLVYVTSITKWSAVEPAGLRVLDVSDPTDIVSHPVNDLIELHNCMDTDQDTFCDQNPSETQRRTFATDIEVIAVNPTYFGVPFQVDDPVTVIASPVGCPGEYFEASELTQRYGYVTSSAGFNAGPEGQDRLSLIDLNPCVIDSISDGDIFVAKANPAYQTEVAVFGDPTGLSTVPVPEADLGLSLARNDEGAFIYALNKELPAAVKIDAVSRDFAYAKRDFPTAPSVPNVVDVAVVTRDPVTGQATSLAAVDLLSGRLYRIDATTGEATVQFDFDDDSYPNDITVNVEGTRLYVSLLEGNVVQEMKTGTAPWSLGDTIPLAIGANCTGGTGTAPAGLVYSAAEGSERLYVGEIPTGKTGRIRVLKRTSPTWARSYGGGSPDDVFSVQQTADGGYVLAGQTFSFGAGGLDLWVLKLDDIGDIEWQKTYGGIDLDLAFFVRQTPDRGYVLAGQTFSFGAGGGDLWVLKLDENGDVGPAFPGTWQKTYGDIGFEAALSFTRDGGYVVAGTRSSVGAGDLDFWVLKLDENGDVGEEFPGTWQKTYGGGSDDIAFSVQQTPDDGYVVAGRTDSFGAGSSDFWVLKLDENGDVGEEFPGTWQKTYGGDGFDQALSVSVQQTPDDGYVVAGEASSFGAGSSDFWVLKLDENGDVGEEFPGTWQKTYGDTSADIAYSIQQTTDGGLAVAGYTYSFGAGSSDFWVLKLDENGDVGEEFPGTWQKTYGGGDFDQGFPIQQTTDGGYVVAGRTNSFGTGNFWVLKLDENGEIDPSCTFIADTTVTGVGSGATPANTTVTGATSFVAPVGTNVSGVGSAAIAVEQCSNPPIWQTEECIEGLGIVTPIDVAFEFEAATNTKILAVLEWVGAVQFVENAGTEWIAGARESGFSSPVDIVLQEPGVYVVAELGAFPTPQTGTVRLFKTQSGSKKIIRGQFGASGVDILGDHTDPTACLGSPCSEKRYVVSDREIGRVFKLDKPVVLDTGHYPNDAVTVGSGADQQVWVCSGEPGLFIDDGTTNIINVFQTVDDSEFTQPGPLNEVPINCALPFPDGEDSFAPTSMAVVDFPVQQIRKVFVTMFDSGVVIVYRADDLDPLQPQYTPIPVTGIIPVGAGPRRIVIQPEIIEAP